MKRKIDEQKDRWVELERLVDRKIDEQKDRKID